MEARFFNFLRDFLGATSISTFMESSRGLLSSSADFPVWEREEKEVLRKAAEVFREVLRRLEGRVSLWGVEELRREVIEVTKLRERSGEC